MFNDLISEIRKLYNGAASIPLHSPVFSKEDKNSVLAAIESGFVSSVGKEVNLFEEELAQFTNCKKAVAVMNGTAALHLGLVISDVKPGDLVITQALTFIATANAIKYTGADPVFLDSDLDTLGLSPTALSNFLETSAEKKNGKAFHKASGKRISACVPMHVFGNPVRIDEIISICNDWGIEVIEDAAEALGSYVDNRHAGTIARVGILSFNGNKVITTGGGGALLFNDEKLAAKAKHLSTTAKVPHSWAFFHDEIGYNYRMPNLNAALGCSQLRQLPEFLKSKKTVAEHYRKFFSTYSEFEFFEERAGTISNHWLNAVLLKDRRMRDDFLKMATDFGVGCRPVWELMADLDIYRNCLRDDLKNARELADRLVNLPSGVPV